MVKLLADIKRCFVKAPARIRLFIEHAPGIPLPPEPVLTRWGTWLSAVSYYAVNLEYVATVFEHFNDEDAAAIEVARKLIRCDVIRSDLAFIHANYGFLPTSIKAL